MKVEFTARAAVDLRKAAAESRSFGTSVGTALETSIRQSIARAAEYPGAYAELVGRPGVHIIPLPRYPYKIFYRVLKDRIRILHIRHTSRRPWMAER